MKIIRTQALEMTAFCRANKLKYLSEGGYHNSVKAARKSNVCAPNGVLIHSPREWIDIDKQALVSSNRTYVMWQGEPVSAIEEACAYIYMISKDREIYIIRCKDASEAAQQVEIQLEIEP